MSNKPNTIHENSFSSDDQSEHDHQAEIAKKLQKKQDHGKKKMGISAEAYGDYNKLVDFKPPVIPKTLEQNVKIRTTLKMNFMFNELQEKDREIVINAMKIKNYEIGEAVITQGTEGYELFIVSEGNLKCEKLFPGQTSPTFLKNYSSGEVFGELSLLYNTPRAASIISNTKSLLFSLDRETFNLIVKTSAMKRRELYENFLKKIKILAGLDDYERSKICDCLKTETFKKGDYILREGDQGDKFYLIQEGLLDAFKNAPGKGEEKVFEFKENDYFGELALLSGDNKRKASIKVMSDTATVASLDKDSFKRLLGPIEAIMERDSLRYSMFQNH